MTVVGDALLKAQLDKANNVRNYIWKGPKVNGVQEEIKLIDCDYNQLRKYYLHCEQMLYNDDAKNPGRFTLINLVSDQIQRCRAELLLRWLRSERTYPATRCLEDLRNVISNNKERFTHTAIKTIPISEVMSGLPIEFERVPISLVMDACLDSLGMMDPKHITTNFLVKMGLLFTNKEMQTDLYRKDPDTGKAVDRLQIVYKELNIDPSKYKLWINYNGGLSFKELKSMLHLIKDKYANLTSDQLRLLSSKILYRFQNRCEIQAKGWQDKMDEIVKVADSKGWDVTRSIE